MEFWSCPEFYASPKAPKPPMIVVLAAYYVAHCVRR